MRVLWVAGLVFGVAMALGMSVPGLAQQRSGPQGENWESIARLPDWSGAWIVPFEDFGRETQRFRDPQSPDAPAWSPSVAAAQEIARRRTRTGVEPAPGAANRQNTENCLPNGMPNVMRYAFAIEFVFTPGRVTVLLESDSLIRRIYTDGRPHAADSEPSYAGDSIGHWEGDTLVVSTRAITANAELLAGQHGSGRVQVTERIRLRDRTHLQIDTVVEDPVMLTAPWRYSRVYNRTTPQFFDNHCQENNRDVNGDEPNLTPPGNQP
jgi:hypothetical protein